MQRLPVDATQRLPSELLLRIFDFFAHGDSPRDFVRGPGRVCARWRRLARAHPSFFKDIWLERDLGPSALGLCQAQLDAGQGADVDLTIVHPEEIGPVVRVIEGSLERCKSLHVEFYGAPAEVRALLGALAVTAAPRLRKLHLRVEAVVDEEDDSADYDGPTSEALVFPADIFRGSAPRLTRLELCGAVCMMLPPLDPIPAFARVESLEIHAYAFGPHAVARALTAAPATRHLEVLAIKHGTGPWPAVHLPPSLQLQLDKVLFSALDGAWDDLLTTLDVYALPEFAVLWPSRNREITDRNRQRLTSETPSDQSQITAFQIASRQIRSEISWQDRDQPDVLLTDADAHLQVPPRGLSGRAEAYRSSQALPGSVPAKRMVIHICGGYSNAQTTPPACAGVTTRRETATLFVPRYLCTSPHCVQLVGRVS